MFLIAVFVIRLDIICLFIVTVLVPAEDKCDVAIARSELNIGSSTREFPAYSYIYMHITDRELVEGSMHRIRLLKFKIVKKKKLINGNSAPPNIYMPAC